MLRRTTLAFLLLLLATAAPLTAQPTGTSLNAAPDDQTVPQLDLDLLESTLHHLINDTRARYGLDTLSISEPLTLVAHRHSADMADHDYFDHINLRGQRITQRARREGIRCEVAENLYQTFYYDSYRTIYTGEHVDVEYDWKSEREIAEDAVEAWLESPAHRETLLTPTYQKHGLGIAVTDALKIFITQDVC